MLFFPTILSVLEVLADAIIFSFTAAFVCCFLAEYASILLCFILNSIVKMVNDSCVIWQSKLRYLPKPHAFSSMPLQSGIFTMNRNFLIGLISSIITAAIGYGLRFIVLNYLEYDVFFNLDNWIPSLTYFCSLGSIRFLISEYLKQNTTLMCYGGGSGSLPVGSNAAGSNLTMQAPNNSGIGSSSAGDASNIDERLKLEQRASKVREKNALL